MPIRTLALVLTLILPFHALADEPNADEEAVWALEEAYWVYVENRDLESYRTLWDERFVGWPRVSVAPVGKQSITDWIPPLHADPGRVYKYELTRKAVRSFGDVVVTHYLARHYWVSAKTGEFLDEVILKLTHTWMQRGNTWQIVTGMAGNYPPKQ